MRADVYLTEKGYVTSRRRARELIESGCVTVDGKILTKPAAPLNEDGSYEIVVTETLPYVGRGGLKLEAALDAFSIDPKGLVALDIGASTGGFTDCLLSRGACRVYAVDAGVGQLAQKLRHDPRVVVRERLNARSLVPEQIENARVDLIVMDVSFISATYILPQYPALLKEDGSAVCLIKPQFEVGKSMLGKGGIVKDPAAHRFAVERVMEGGRAFGLCPVGLIPSPVMGGDGNREFLICFAKGKTDLKELQKEDIPKLIK